MPTVILSLGTNLGNRLRNMEHMEEHLSSMLSSPFLRSPLYETAPLGVGTEHQPYLNRIVAGGFFGTPFDLLRACQKIERDLGRSSKGNLSPRTADIDILLYGYLSLESEELTIPHKGIMDRRFCIEGLAAMYPEKMMPGLGLTFEDMKAGMRGEVRGQGMRTIESKG